MAKETRKKQAPNRKKMARVERERLQNRLIVIIAIVMISSVFLVVIGGVLFENVIKPSQPVAIANGQEISTTDYQNRVRYERVNLINNYYQSYQMLEMFASSADLFTQVQSGLLQIDTQLENSGALGQDVVDKMIDSILIREEAQRRGITVSDEEIETRVQELFGYFPNGTPTPTNTAVVPPTATLSTTQLALITLTPTWTPFPTATDAPTATPDPDLEPTPAPTEGPEPTATYTATPYTFEAYQEQVNDYLTFLDEDMQTTLTLDDFRSIAEEDIYTQKLLADIKQNDVDKAEERVWARHILVETEAEAQDVLDRLASGEDWATIAAEVSLDTSNKDLGGDLGWFNRQIMVDAFSEASFAAEVGETVGPVQTDFGYHIIQVLGHEDQPLSESEISRLATVTLQTLLEELRNDGEVEVKDYLLDRTPSEPSLPADLVQSVREAQPAVIPTPESTTP
ncbi:MAG: peptidylprolyl isomerase [Anaerolineales bacterium]|nr:peptidylprolyl isomerase [Anaerolineales bacterium]